MSARPECPACGSSRVEVFHEVRQVPVNSVLSLESREEARAFPRGDIRLAFCDDCGFIHNAAFEPARLEYSERYDPTQAFSPTFNRWHRRLAEQLVERHELRGKEIIEIGCGKGEFLALLCQLGDNHGLGFDPAFDQDRLQLDGTARVDYVADFYSEKYAGLEADFVCCKMTLEHIAGAADFVDMVRRTVGHRPDTTVFFQVPDARRILEEQAFWDIYYEHCSYFTAGSLARLFRRCRLDVRGLEREFDAQYVTVEARPLNGAASPALAAEDDLDELRALVRRFTTDFAAQRDRWRERVRAVAADGARVVLWGSGSKGVAFLTTLGLGSEVLRVVDINPHRQGKHMLGTGHRIVAPEELRAIEPDVVIVMNPIYRDEIAADLSRLGLAPEVWTT
jgi:SAM-dependent methyltransferase